MEQLAAWFTAGIRCFRRGAAAVAAVIRVGEKKVRHEMSRWLLAGRVGGAKVPGPPTKQVLWKFLLNSELNKRICDVKKLKTQHFHWQDAINRGLNIWFSETTFDLLIKCWLTLGLKIRKINDSFWMGSLNKLKPFEKSIENYGIWLLAIDMTLYCC